ncbi:hypothetical protein D3C85_1228160 [compost metagenome]
MHTLTFGVLIQLVIVCPPLALKQAHKLPRYITKQWAVIARNTDKLGVLEIIDHIHQRNQILAASDHDLPRQKRLRLGHQRNTHFGYNAKIALRK